jgi:site-specific recombinase XerD
MLISEPKLVKAASAWYIEYYDLSKTGEKIHRNMPRCGINRIKDLQQREEKAELEIEKICKRHGFVRNARAIRLPETNLIEALHLLLEYLEATSNKVDTTVRTYRDMSDSFIKFLNKKELTLLRCCDLTEQHVRSYFDYRVIECRNPRSGEKIKNNTHNNHKTNLRALFNKLIARGYCTENHFCKIENFKKNESVNRPLEEEESHAFFQEVFKTDSQLSYAVLLISRCGIRSYKELCFLKPKNFNFKDFLIRLKGEQTKSNNEDQYVTIPEEIVPFLMDFMRNIPNNWYILGSGKGLLPHPTEHFGKNAMYERHKKVVMRLQEQGKIVDAQGKSIYQWKHFEAQRMVNIGAVDPETLRKHLRHKEIATTQRYFQRKERVQVKILGYKTGFVPGEIAEEKKPEITDKTQIIVKKRRKIKTEQRN